MSKKFSNCNENTEKVSEESVDEQNSIVKDGFAQTNDLNFGEETTIDIGSLLKKMKKD